MSFIWSFVDTKPFRVQQDEAIGFQFNNDDSSDVVSINKSDGWGECSSSSLSGLTSKVSSTRAINRRKIVQILECGVGASLLVVAFLSLFGILPIPNVAAFAIIGGGGVMVADVIIGMIINLVRNRDQKLFKEIINKLAQDDSYSTARIAYSNWLGKKYFLYFTTSNKKGIQVCSVSQEKLNKRFKSSVLENLPEVN